MQPLTFDLTSADLSAPFTSCPPFPPRLHPSLPLSLCPYLSQAKVDNEIIDYRDLAAIPRVKAIYDIEHPDMISYKCANGNSSTLDNKGNRQERQSPAEVTSCANHASSHSVACFCVIDFKSCCLALTRCTSSDQTSKLL